MPLVTMTMQDIQRMVNEALQSKDSAKMMETENLLNLFLNKDPESWMLRYMMASLQQGIGKYGAAVCFAEMALAQYPPLEKQIPMNLGAIYRRLNDNERAMRWLKRALEANPDDPDALNNYGTCYVNEGQPEEGEKWCRKALAVNPAHPHAHWNLSLCLLEQGRWAEGFHQYQWGHVTRDRMNKVYIDARGRSAPWWRGQKVGTLVAYGEQGVGDEVMYLSMVDDLRLFCDRLILDVHPRLEHVVKRCFPDVDVYPTRKEYAQPPEWARTYEAIDAKVALGTAATFLRTDESLFPRKPYLHADPELMAKARMAAMPYGRPMIGVSWVGGVTATRKDLRAVSVRDLVPMFQAIPEAVWVSTQYDDRRADIDWLKQEHGIDVLHLPEWSVTKHEAWFEVWKEGQEVARYRDKEDAKIMAAQLGAELRAHAGPAFDLERQFALLSACDFNVSVNQSNVHFCGAMGAPCFTLTPSKPAWRYGMSRTDMVWYPKYSVRQYRQQGDDWAGAIDTLTKDLRERVCRRPKLVAI